jgi:hypothetical protein
LGQRRTLAQAATRSPGRRSTLTGGSMRITLRVVPVLIVLAALAPLFMLPTPGKSTPLYATRTGLACANCHFDPNGGGPRNAFGFAYAKNRHSTEPETDGMFKDLDLTNKVGEQFPLYFGVNSRLMALADDARDPPDGVDRFGFFQMENQIHMAFQPHPRLTLVYTTDGFGTQNNPLSGGVRVSRAVWGMLGIGANHYLRAGIFRVPFGLSMDDHTTASRNGFQEFQPNGFNPLHHILPYDPRIGDEGIEVGGTKGEFQGRLAYTDGGSFVFSGPPNPRAHAQAFSGKLAYVDEKYQVGVSGYDNWLPANGPGSTVRAQRWGTYAMTGRGKMSFIGEVVSGTDQVSASAAGSPYTNINKLGYFIEGDYQASRAANFRLRYDHLEGYRHEDATNNFDRDQDSYNRYALEGDVVPVPFCEIRWTLRLIDPVADKNPGGVDRDTEKQAYVQFHFSY